MTTIHASARRGPGRPPKSSQSQEQSREALIRAGLAALTEYGFYASGLDGLLKAAGVPKGSFYHYFASKEAFGLAVLEAYDHYFARKLKRHFDNPSLTPLARLAAFVADAKTGLARHDYRRGCLVGNLGQEIGVLPQAYAQALESTFAHWQGLLAACLADAVRAGELAPQADCPALAQVFWLGWEGAVMRARLVKSAAPLDSFVEFYLAGLPRPAPITT